MQPHYTHRVIERRFPTDPSDLLPPITADNAPFWDGLQRGGLFVQKCAECGRTRFPVAPVCPHCSSDASDWRELSGRGTVFSWVRYHRSYLPEFADLLPYVVLLVQLEDGPRTFGRLLPSHRDPVIGDAVSLVIEQWPNGRHVPAFALEGETP